MDYTVHGILHWTGLPCPPPRDLPNPGIEPRSPTLQTDSLLYEPLGKPKNTGVGSHSLLQGIFPTQGSNPGLPHCRQILYQLSHKGSPSGKEPTRQCRRRMKQGFSPWVGKSLWRRVWQPTSVFLSGESHGQRSLADYSPWGRKSWT